MERYFVYTLARSDTTAVFYVGKGSRRRERDHVMEARKGHKCPKCSVIRKLLRGGETILYDIIFRTDDEQKAFAVEIETIARYGRENLCNLTDGGDGASGNRQSAETIEKRRRSMRVVMATTDYRDRLRATTKASWDAPEIRERRLAAQRAAMGTDEYRAHQSVVMKAIASAVEPEERARRTAAQRHMWEDQDRRDKQRERSAAMMADPERRRQQRAALEAYWETDEARKEARDRMTARYADPEERQRHAERARQASANPETKARKSAASKAAWTDPVIRERRITGQKATFARPEQKAKRSAATTARYADPEERRKQSERSTAAMARPEVKAKKSAAMTTLWNDPEYRAKMEHIRNNNGKPKNCIVEGCTRKVHGNGLCLPHYKRVWRAAKKSLAMHDAPDSPELININIEAIGCPGGSHIDQAGNDAEAEQDYCQTSIDLLLLD